MNLEVEVFLTSRVVQIDTNNARIAAAYGRYSESLSDEDFEELVELIQEDVMEEIEFEITDVRMGRTTKRPWLTREEGE